MNLTAVPGRRSPTADRGATTCDYPSQYNELVLGLLDDGEVLIDDIRVVENPGTAEARQLIQNGDFQSDALGQ